MMVTFNELLTTMKQVYDATEIHVRAETDPDIRQGMEINLDLLDRALTDAGWPHGRHRQPTTKEREG